MWKLSDSDFVEHADIQPVIAGAGQVMGLPSLFEILLALLAWAIMLACCVLAISNVIQILILEKTYQFWWAHAVTWILVILPGVVLVIIGSQQEWHAEATFVEAVLGVALLLYLVIFPVATISHFVILRRLRYKQEFDQWKQRQRERFHS